MKRRNVTNQMCIVVAHQSFIRELCCSDPGLSCASDTGSGEVGWSPLLRAAWNGHTDTTAALAAAARSVGVDPGAAPLDPGGRTALMLSAFHGYDDVVKLLAEVGKITRLFFFYRTRVLVAFSNVEGHEIDVNK